MFFEERSCHSTTASADRGESREKPLMPLKKSVRERVVPKDRGGWKRGWDGWWSRRSGEDWSGAGAATSQSGWRASRERNWTTSISHNNPSNDFVRSFDLGKHGGRCVHGTKGGDGSHMTVHDMAARHASQYARAALGVRGSPTSQGNLFCKTRSGFDVHVNHNGHSSFNSSGAPGFNGTNVSHALGYSPLNNNGSSTRNGRLDLAGAANPSFGWCRFGPPCAILSFPSVTESAPRNSKFKPFGPGRRGIKLRRSGLATAPARHRFASPHAFGKFSRCNGWARRHRVNSPTKYPDLVISASDVFTIRAAMPGPFAAVPTRFVAKGGGEKNLWAGGFEIIPFHPS